ncbi:glucoamylase family protein [Maribacter sp. 2210JD10-5]|uniref:glucoamylase family protein n=1 Tax=Maribacter sp. 2210JD10-5 TaxID=3386272 RepID=UPI0039BD338B
MKRICSYIFFSAMVLMFASCDEQQGPVGVSELPEEAVDDMPKEEEPELTDEELLDLTQLETFRYFWDFAQSDSGGARERYHPNEPSRDQNTVATGGTGFGLMAILVGIERGFVTKEEGMQRLTNILSFLESADRFHGAWPHWINGSNGNTIPFSEKDNGGDLVETAFLVQGLICIKEYFEEGDDAEKALAAKADILWKGVEWDWYTQGEDTLYWHWSPNFGFDINLELKGYNEVLIAYILGAASPDYTISKNAYTNGWASNGGIISSDVQYGLPLVAKHAGNTAYGGPLFWAHYSYLGLDPRNLSDEFVNYTDVNVNHSKINYQYCVDNPNNFLDYGKDCWGLTASYSRNNDGNITYRAHRPGSNDIGVISPTAALSSMPYTPEESMRALRYFYSHKDKLLGPAGFYDAFSPQYDFWVAEAYLAIDQGPIIVMIENHRTELLWRLFMKNEDVRSGLEKLGFSF